jgi:hypothetical protein
MRGRQAGQQPEHRSPAAMGDDDGEKVYRSHSFFKSDLDDPHGGWHRSFFVRRAGPSHVHPLVGPRTD